MLRLHYVLGGQGSHDFGHLGQNSVAVTQRRETGSTKWSPGHIFKQLENLLLKCVVVERGERSKT